MKKIIITLLAVTIIFTGCSNKQPEKSLISQLLSYQDSYVGDAGAVSHIIGLLPGNEFTLNGISLQTTTEPYVISVEYVKNEENEADFAKFWTEENTKKVLLNNAAVLFSLVQNVGEVHF
ncbi:MAG: DUF4825 domain-containing protein, partial [Bacillaceae bacterium]